MTTYMAIRSNEVKMVLNNVTIKANGEVWAWDRPLIDSQSDAYKADPDGIKAANANKQWDKIPAAAIAHRGINPTGLRVVEQSEYLAAKEAARTPAQRERDEISKLYAKARRLEDSDSEDNVRGPIMIRSEANRRLAAWQTKYPAEAAAELKQDMLDKATDLRSKAQGAMLYDCDGSMSYEDQCASRDNWIRKAEALEAEAATINQ